MTIKQVNIIADDDKYLPVKGTPESAGYDCTVCNISYSPRERCVIYDLGFKIELPRGYYLDMRPRSSIYKVGPWVLSNSCGVVDSDYQGRVKAIFKCVDAEWDLTDIPYEIGDKACQAILTPYIDMSFNKVQGFVKKTERGTGGFGSTTKKKSSRKKDDK